MAPGILVASILLTFAVVPFAPGFNVLDSNIAILFFLGNSSLGVYSVVLGGWASNNKYSLLGAMRASAQMLHEVFMGLSLMGVVMMADSFNMREIVKPKAWLVYLSTICWICCFSHSRHCRDTPTSIRYSGSRRGIGGWLHSEYSGMKFGCFSWVNTWELPSLIHNYNHVFRRMAGPAFLPPIIWFF